jgi:HK97 gp10 family phage protein
MAFDIRITGDNSQEFIDELERRIPVALEECGLVAEGYAKRLCPVDTGRLRNSITHTVNGDIAYIGTNVEYAPYVELGTSRTRAQPFLKPAVADHASEYKRVIENGLKE